MDESKMQFAFDEKLAFQGPTSRRSGRFHDSERALSLETR
jgi:hypothetical protein